MYIHILLHTHSLFLPLFHTHTQNTVMHTHKTVHTHSLIHCTCSSFSCCSCFCADSYSACSCCIFASCSCVSVFLTLSSSWDIFSFSSFSYMCKYSMNVILRSKCVKKKSIKGSYTFSFSSFLSSSNSWASCSFSAT